MISVCPIIVATVTTAKIYTCIRCHHYHSVTCNYHVRSPPAYNSTCFRHVEKMQNADMSPSINLMNMQYLPISEKRFKEKCLSATQSDAVTHKMLRNVPRLWLSNSTLGELTIIRK
jgi:hypothetical protein